jgi:hypothetical protein
VVCPTMSNISIELIRIIRTPCEIFTTNEHVMDGSNDSAVIELEGESTAFSNTGNLSSVCRL